MEERKLIYFSRRQGDCPVCNAIEPSDWQVARVQDASKAASLIASGPYHVGIALMENAGTRSGSSMSRNCSRGRLVKLPVYENDG